MTSRVHCRYWVHLILTLLTFKATPSFAQQPSGPAVTETAETTAESQAQPAANGDSGFLNFFRKTELAGTADMYFHYNFNEPKTGSLTPLRNFDFEHNQFSFALAELALIKPADTDDRIGFRFDFDYGPVANWVASADPGTPGVFQNIQQAYISYLAPVGTGLTFDIGKFVTQHGAEVIEAKDNWNYSRSLLFSWAIPYYHMGVRVAYSPSDMLTLGGAIVNGWNNTKDNNSQKTYGLQAVIRPTAAVSIVQNYMAGPEQTDNTGDWRHLADTTVTYTVNDTLSVMGNYDYGRDEVAGSTATWQGIGVYAKVQANQYFAVIPRYEYYNDEDGFTTGTGQNAQELTLTGEVKHSQGLMMRLEYRRDWSDISFFTKNRRPRDNQNTFSVGFVYAFSTKQ